MAPGDYPFFRGIGNSACAGLRYGLAQDSCSLGTTPAYPVWAPRGAFRPIGALVYAGFYTGYSLGNMCIVASALGGSLHLIGTAP